MEDLSSFDELQLAELLVQSQLNIARKKRAIEQLKEELGVQEDKRDIILKYLSSLQSKRNGGSSSCNDRLSF